MKLLYFIYNCPAILLFSCVHLNICACQKWLYQMVKWFVFTAFAKSFTYFTFSLVRVHYLFFIWLHLFIMQKTFQKIIFIKSFCVCLFIYKHQIFGKCFASWSFMFSYRIVVSFTFIVSGKEFIFFLYFTLIRIYFYICLAINLFFIVVLPEMFFQRL